MHLIQLGQMTITLLELRPAVWTVPSVYGWSGTVLNLSTQNITHLFDTFWFTLIEFILDSFKMSTRQGIPGCTSGLGQIQNRYKIGKRFENLCRTQGNTNTSRAGCWNSPFCPTETRSSAFGQCGGRCSYYRVEI